MRTLRNARFLAGGLAAWPVLMAIATIDGLLRMKSLIPMMGLRAALIVSGIIMLFATYVVAWLLMAWWGRPRSDSYLWIVGAAWVVLTVLFEIAIVVLGRGETIATALYGYHPSHLLEGNLILPGLVLMLLAPVIVARVRRADFALASNGN